jgi:uncharacterized protein YjbI with pentapeptide repeats
MFTQEDWQFLEYVRDAATNPQRLAEIYYSEPCNQILAMLAANPNTPVEILLCLGKQFPETVLLNPAMGLYFLDLEFFLTIPSDTLTSFLNVSIIDENLVKLIFTLSLVEKKIPKIIATAALRNYSETFKEWKQQDPYCEMRLDLSQGMFNHLNLSGDDLSYLNLTQAVFASCNLVNIDLTYANLQEAKFKHCNLHGANLRKANLKGSEFLFSKLLRTNLTRCDLTNSTFNFTDVDRADFSFATLENASFCNTDIVKAIK